MKLFDKYLFALVGEEVRAVDSMHIETIKRTRNYGLLIHIPIMVWFFLGFYLSIEIFDSSIWVSMLSATISAIVIYAIDYSIINSPKSIGNIILRIILGLIFAIAGAVLLDIRIFEKDIQSHINKTYIGDIKNDYELKINNQEVSAEKKRLVWLAAELTANCEADGSCGSQISKERTINSLMEEKNKIISNFDNKRKEVISIHNEEIKRCGLFCSDREVNIKRDDALLKISLNEAQAIKILDSRIMATESLSTAKSSVGRGPVYLAKAAHAKNLKGYYDEANISLNQLKQELNGQLNLTVISDFKDVGIITKVKALHSLASEKAESIIFYIVFFLIFLSFELILVLSKILSSETLDDKKLKYQSKQDEIRLEINFNKLKQYQKIAEQGIGSTFEIYS